MKSTWLRVALFAVVLVAPRTSTAAHVEGTACDAGIPADETTGFRSFPRGNVFCPFLADPKAGSFASYLRASSSSVFGTDLGSIGVADDLGIFRWNGPTVGEGLQFGIDAGVFAQFDLNVTTFDLLNADYTLGLPLTFRRGRFSSRLRVYHQSSHLGDQLAFRAGVPAEENFAFEAGEAMLSFDLAALRVYGGGELVFNLRPIGGEDAGVAHAGVELRQPGALFPSGSRNRVRLVAALDVKAADQRDWEPAWSARAGLEMGRTPGAEHLSRPWRLLAEYYDGPSPYGYFAEDVRSYGVGLHLGD